MVHTSHNTLLTVTKALDNQAEEIDGLIKLSGGLTTELTTLQNTVAELKKESPARKEAIEKIAAAMVANAMAEHTKQKTVKSLADYNHHQCTASDRSFRSKWPY